MPNPVGKTTQAVGNALDNASAHGVETKWQHHGSVKVSETKPINEAGLRAEGTTASQPIRRSLAEKCKSELSEVVDNIGAAWSKAVEEDVTWLKELNGKTPIQPTNDLIHNTDCTVSHAAAGGTVLHALAEKGYLRAMKAAIEKGANRSIKNYAGKTAEMLLNRESRMELKKMLKSD
ncbi:hypothetical protein [Endozoicomonas sp.]|uniref:hypothetical protein n=1 Tax=Endozoicomonas sp. TaxID=1892382 RepID=UPI003839F611